MSTFNIARKFENQGIIQHASGHQIGISWNGEPRESTLPLADKIQEKYSAFDEPFTEFLRVAKDYANKKYPTNPLNNYRFKKLGGEWMENVDFLVEVPVEQVFQRSNQYRNANHPSTRSHKR